MPRLADFVSRAKAAPSVSALPPDDGLMLDLEPSPELRTASAAAIQASKRVTKIKELISAAASHRASLQSQITETESRIAKNAVSEALGDPHEPVADGHLDKLIAEEKKARLQYEGLQRELDAAERDQLPTIAALDDAWKRWSLGWAQDLIQRYEAAALAAAEIGEICVAAVSRAGMDAMGRRMQGCIASIYTEFRWGDGEARKIARQAWITNPRAQAAAAKIGDLRRELGLPK